MTRNKAESQKLKAESGKVKAERRRLKVRRLKLQFAFVSTVFCFLICCTGPSDKTENTAQNSSPKFKQYYNQGEQLYVKHCSNCHQKDGSGLGRLYPPLNKSDYMNKNFEDVICLIRNGKKGELIVNGVSFNQPMPGVPTLTDLEIAEIATYIYNTWEHKRGITEVKDISKILTECPQPE
jgi:mono/diheme cytochrome c family protein